MNFKCVLGSIYLFFTAWDGEGGERKRKRKNQRKKVKERVKERNKTLL